MTVFTCITGKKVQILTQKTLLEGWRAILLDGGFENTSLHANATLHRHFVTRENIVEILRLRQAPRYAAYVCMYVCMYDKPPGMLLIYVCMYAYMTMLPMYVCMHACMTSPQV